jgi:hypothetical protein
MTNGTAGHHASAASARPAPAPKKIAATTMQQTPATTGKTSSERSRRTTAQLSFVRSQPRRMRFMAGP